MSPRFQHGFENDVFLSYTHVDDQADVTARKWVSQFEIDLRTRLEQVSGCTVNIWRDNKLGASDRFDGEIAAQIRQSAVLLTVLTPSYFRSDYCRKERELFWQGAPDLGHQARVVKCAKTRVDLDAYPADLKSLLEYRFYAEEPSGVCREFHLHEDPLVRQRYATRIDDVATEIARLLARLEKGAPAVSKGAIFLAEATSDLDEPRAELRRSLIQRGYEVLPQAPLRLLTAPQIREAVAADLARSKAAVHPIGAAYGVIPELGAGASIARIQLEVAAAFQPALPRLIWLPPELKPLEEPQTELVARIRNEWAGNPFQLIEGPPQDLETHLIDTLERPAAPPPILDLKLDAKPAKKRPSVYLLSADDADRKASRGVRFWLHGQELDVEWPSRDADAEQKHRRHLMEDEAFLIYCGQASVDWVSGAVAQIAAAEAGRAAPIASRAVFLADPQTDDKLDFLTHDAEIIEAYGGPPVEKVLMPFLSQVRAAWPPKSSAAGGTA